MKLLDKKEESNVMTAVIAIEPHELAEARRAAYLDETERWPVPGIAPGLASIEEIEKTCGADALMDGALARALPAAYSQFLAESGVRTVGRPEVSSVTLTRDGGARFTARAALYPKVKLGDYKGIAVPEARTDEEEFRMAVLREACRGMEAEVPVAMTEARLDAMTAQEKLRVCGDAVYHLLADVVALVHGAYEAAGVTRPAAQVRAEALDIMLQAVSSDNGTPSFPFILSQLRAAAERYRPLPDGFDEHIKTLASERSAKRGAMTPEEQADEAFGAYLGSIGGDEKTWRAERRKEAEEAARCDLLLEATAEAEGLEASDADVDALAAQIAEKSCASPEEVIEHAGRETMRRQLLRDKACRLIVGSAVSAVVSQSAQEAGAYPAHDVAHHTLSQEAPNK